MKIFTQSIRNGQTVYTACDGMSEATILSLLGEIGHTDIVVVTEQVYLDNQPSI